MTDNPWLIMVINMTIVFGVLIVLGILMNIIHAIDPTKKVQGKKKPVVASRFCCSQQTTGRREGGCNGSGPGHGPG